MPCRSPLALLLLLAAAVPAWADGEGLDSVMYHDPELPGPKVVPDFSAALKPAWAAALARPEASYKVGAAQTIAEAHARGYKGLDTVAPDLVRELERKDQSAEVRLAVARALVALDAKVAAPQLFAQLPTADADLREVIEPALSAWGHEPARAVWLERLNQTPARRPTVLAIRGLLAAKEEKAVPRLQALAADRAGVPVVRLEAAKALAEFRPSGSEGLAKELAAHAGAEGIPSRLVAAAVLRRHDGDAATRLLQTLATDPEPTVAAAALTRLVELDPKQVAPVLDAAIANDDTAVRLLAVAALRRDPTPRNLTRLADRLEDVHPAVRTQARLALVKLFARPDLQPAIRAETTRVLGGRNWGGLQQAALLAAAFDLKPAVNRLIDLGSHDRGEVFVTAAWAVRKLAVPATDAAVLDLFKRRAAFPKARADALSPVVKQAVDEQLGQLAMRLGEAKYTPADPTFRALVPPQTGGVETRAAAVWALGKIHEGKTNLGFEAAVLARLNAVNPFDVEETSVRQMCAVTLGRVRYQRAVDSLKRFCPSGRPSPDVVSNACGWALERITGEKFPPPGEAKERFSNFFLVPIEGN